MLLHLLNTCILRFTKRRLSLVKLFFKFNYSNLRLNEVDWEGKNIVVMNSVIISPPYEIENCKSRNGEQNQAVDHVKKIVNFFFI